MDTPPPPDGRLEAWAAEQGLSAPSLAAAALPARLGGRGLVATAAIAPGEILLACPDALLMTVGTVSRDPVLGPPLRVLIAAAPKPDASKTAAGDAEVAPEGEGEGRGPPALTPEAVLALALLNELAKGAASRWAPYLSSLPRRVDTLVTWCPEAAALLGAPHAIAAAAAAARRPAAAAVAAAPAAAAAGLPAAVLTPQAYAWALSIVSSRTVHHPLFKGGALVPMGDLFNFAPPGPPHTPLDDHDTDEAAGAADAADIPVGQASDAERVAGTDGIGPSGSEPPLAVSIGSDGAHNRAARRYEFVARRAYAPGEEVRMAYGAHTQLALLEHYGFLLEHAEEEEAQGEGNAAEGRGGAAGVAAGQAGPASRQAADSEPRGLGAALAAAARRPPANPHDAAPVAPAALGTIGAFVPAGADPKTDLFFHADGSPSWHLLAAARLSALPSELRRREGHRALCGEPVGGAAAEETALKRLAAAAEASLRALRGSAAEDHAQLLAAQREADAAAARARAAEAAGASEAAPALWLPWVPSGGPAAQAAADAAAVAEQRALALRWRSGHRQLLTRAAARLGAAAQRLAGPAAAARAREAEASGRAAVVVRGFGP